MAAPFTVTQEELKSFHKIDRDLYTRLVINLGRDIEESKLVMGVWLWLEEIGFPNVIKRILSLPADFVVNALADEAMEALKYISRSDAPPPPPPYNNLPLTVVLLEQDISVQFFYDNRVIASNRIKNFVENVCNRAFGDIIQQGRQAAAVQARVVRGTGVVRLPSGSIYDERGRYLTVQPVIHPGLQSFQRGASSSNVTPIPNNENVPRDERTMFVTFSRGYYVSEEELRECFTSKYGDCVEAVYMQELRRNTQPLYARVVFRSLSTIALMLEQTDKAKFTINGKNIWARKYVPKDNVVPGSSSGGGQ